jgi:ATPase family AAA domain-containing protein 3A/B
VAIAKAEADRANEDIHLRRLRAESEQRRKRNIAAINAIFTHLSTSLSNAVRQPKEVLTFVGYVCLLVSSIFFARETSKLIRSIIESFIGRPQLVRETTRQSMPWSLIPWIRKSKRDTKSIEDTFSDLILPQELKSRIVELAHSAKNANKHDAPYRHVLLHGSPGTGKTL